MVGSNSSNTTYTGLPRCDSLVSNFTMPGPFVSGFSPSTLSCCVCFLYIIFYVTVTVLVAMQRIDPKTALKAIFDSNFVIIGFEMGMMSFNVGRFFRLSSAPRFCGVSADLMKNQAFLTTCPKPSDSSSNWANATEMLDSFGSGGDGTWTKFVLCCGLLTYVGFMFLLKPIQVRLKEEELEGGDRSSFWFCDPDLPCDECCIGKMVKKCIMIPVFCVSPAFAVCSLIPDSSWTEVCINASGRDPYTALLSTMIAGGCCFFVLLAIPVWFACSGFKLLRFWIPAITIAAFSFFSLFCIVGMFFTEPNGSFQQAIANLPVALAAAAHAFPHCCAHHGGHGAGPSSSPPLTPSHLRVVASGSGMAAAQYAETESLATRSCSSSSDIDGGGGRIQQGYGYGYGSVQQQQQPSPYSPQYNYAPPQQQQRRLPYYVQH